MSNQRTEYHLLLGILALQLNFISREQLLAATNTWVLDKRKPFDEVLQEQGALAADTRALLLALVEKHLAMHGDNAEKSLAAVNASPQMRESLGQINDSDVQASLVRCAAGRPAGEDPFVTQPRSVGGPTSAGSRFRILRPHAKGGLGEVFVAEDEELRREVALKQIQNRYADDADSRSRFLLEAEITGGLEHPSIVPVYGLGTYADGRPYYAMRFIRGDSLKDAIERFHRADTAKHDPGEWALTLRKLLQRFIDVCNAIEYAHSRDVLHRDLKPGNIMLGKYGETLVVDWGLAKPRGKQEHSFPSDEQPLQPSSGSGSTPTQMGSAIGTPQFMSPEQAAGRHDLLGPASDIYSLGATLYCLLTGRPPFEAQDVGEILRKVQAGDYPAPRQVNRLVAPGLDAICCKAMALRPSDRYGSPRALADDIEHWLADEPISARRETLPQRAGRWARKHRAMVGSAGVALLLVAAISLVAAVAVNESRKQAAALAETNGRLAVEERAARDQAAEQRNLALETLNSLVFDIQDQMQGVPALHDLKRKILATAAKNLAKVSQPLAGNDRRADRLTAVAYDKTGDILLTLGSVAEATGSFRSAQQVFEQLAEADPRDALAQIDLSISYDKLGNMSVQQGDLAAGRKFYEQNLAVIRRLAEADPRDTEAQSRQSLSYERLGDVSLQEGNLAAGRKFYEQGLEIRQRLAKADPKDDQVRRSLSISYEKLGDVSVREGDLAAGHKLYEQVLAIRRHLAEADSGDAEAQNDLSFSYSKLGEISVQQGDLAAARTFYEQGLDIRRRRAEADPRDVEAQSDLSSSYSRLGDVRVRQGDLAAARKLYEQSLDIRRRRAESDPLDVEAQRDLAYSYDNLGYLTVEQGDLAGGRKFYEQDLEISRRLAEADSRDAQKQRDLALVYERLGNVSEREGDLAKARKFYEQGLEIRRRLAEADPRDAQAQHALSVSYNQLGNVRTQQKDLAEGRKLYEQGLKISQRLAEADPRDAQVQRSLSISYEKLGDVSVQEGDLVAAHGLYEQGLEIRQRLAKADPHNAPAQGDLSLSYGKLGAVCAQQGDLAAARKFYEQSLEIARRRQAEADPRDVQAQLVLMISYIRLGNVSEEEKDYPRAIEEFQAAAKVLQRMIDAGMLVEASRRELAKVQKAIEECQAAKPTGAANKDSPK